MNGDGFGSPPWGPADPVPELEDTQALPGLGSIPGSGEQPGRPHAGWDYGSQAGDRTANGQESNGAGPDDPALNGPGTGDQGSGSGTKQDAPAGGKHGKGGKRGGKGKRPRSFWRELPVLIVVALVLALIIKAFAIQAFYIPSGSMENTLEVNDRVLVNKVVYHLRSIHRGDIIVFDGTGSWDFNTPPGSSNIFSKAIDELEGLVGISQDPNIYIKRVIGLPGDHVVCCNTKGQITVNGVPLTESSYLYPGNAPSTQKFNITVPAGRLWVMGDHRSVSYDSRGHMGDPGGGTIPESGVIGRAFVIIWPPSQWGFLNIPATFEQPQLNASNAAGGNAAAGGSSAALEAALNNGTPIRPTTSPIPLALGFVGAVPITWLQRKARRRLKSRRPRHQPRLLRPGASRTLCRRGWRTLPLMASSFTPRRDAGLAAYENVLARAGLAPVAGIDEAGRGACAGPLVVAAVVLDKTSIKRIQGLADSKLLTPAAREDAYEDIVKHAVDWHVITVPHTEIDAIGLHVCNIVGMRRACAGLTKRPAYVLTDGFPVQGLGAPALAMWKGDRVAASVAAASIVAKVTRDRMMRELDERYPVYGFCRHKGYVTDEHLRALAEHGPSPVHRRSFRCVPDGRPTEGE